MAADGEAEVVVETKDSASDAEDKAVANEVAMADAAAMASKEQKKSRC